MGFLARSERPLWVSRSGALKEEEDESATLVAEMEDGVSDVFRRYRILRYWDCLERDAAEGLKASTCTSTASETQLFKPAELGAALFREFQAEELNKRPDKSWSKRQEAKSNSSSVPLTIRDLQIDLDCDGHVLSSFGLYGKIGSAHGLQASCVPASTYHHGTKHEQMIEGWVQIVNEKTGKCWAVVNNKFRLHSCRLNKDNQFFALVPSGEGFQLKCLGMRWSNTCAHEPARMGVRHAVLKKIRKDKVEWTGLYGVHLQAAGRWDSRLRLKTQLVGH